MADDHHQQLLKKIVGLNSTLRSTAESTNAERRKERVELLHKYNETKDSAQIILGAVSSLKGVCLKETYKLMQIDFDQ